MKFRLLIIFFIFCCVIPSELHAQLYNFRSYSIEDGLPQASVYDVIQDRNGFLWLATAGGLSRFDGNHFVNYTTAEGLRSNRVNCLLEDELGNIWIGTGDGIMVKSFSYRFKTDSLPFFYITTDDGITSNSINYLIQDSRNRIWVGTNKGVSMITIDTASSLNVMNISSEDGLVHDRVHSLYEDSLNNIWVATHMGVSCIRIDENNNSSYKIQNLTKTDGLIYDEVWDLLEDDHGNMWFTAIGGILTLDISKWLNDEIIDFTIYDKTSHQRIDYVKTCFKDSKGNILVGGSGLMVYDGNKFTYFNHFHGLENGAAMSIIEDREGNYWLGTSAGGIYRFSGKTFSVFSTKHGLPHNSARALIEDTKGNIWFGSRNLTGFLKNPHNILGWKPDQYDIHTFSNKTYNVSVPQATWSLLEDRKGNVWIGTGRGLFRYTPPIKGKSKEVLYHFYEKHGINSGVAIMTIFEDSKGTIWYGGFLGLIRYNENENHFEFFTQKEHGLPSDVVSAIHEDAKGNLWIGTRNGLAKCQDCVNGEIEFEIFDKKAGLATDRVSLIKSDRDGNLWLGTSTGISKYLYPVLKSSRGTFKNYTVKDGLNSDTPYILFVDSRGFLWVGTNKGVDKFFIKWGNFKLIKHYGLKEGFTGIELNHDAVCEDVQGNIWFGTIDGVIKYDPREDHSNLIEPQTSINDLKVFLESSPFPPDAEFPYDRNHLTFGYSGISLTIPEKVKYQYKLEGFDKDWLPVTKQTFATYSYLPPGKFTFKVKACNNDGVWNKNPTTYSFAVTPPFWKTYWFYAITTLVFIFSIVGVIKWRERNLKFQKKVLEDRVQERTAELKIAVTETKKQKQEIEEKNKKLWQTALAVNRERDKVIEIKNELEETNRNIVDSINYASNIQQAMLTPIKVIHQELPNSFVYYQPLDVVSGDFYFFKKLDNTKNKKFRNSVVLAAIDCTGHGVPGAFMSMLGNELLNHIVKEQEWEDAGDILNKMHMGILTALRQRDQDSETRDGMDVALCIINTEKRIVHYAGAHRPLFIVSENFRKKNEDIKNERYVIDGTLGRSVMIKPDRVGVGGEAMVKRDFTSHQIDLEKGDTIYMYSDGFGDQFGGEKDKKYKSRRFREFLEQLYSRKMKDQSVALSRELFAWKSDHSQTDDVMVLGVRL